MTRIWILLYIFQALVQVQGRPGFNGTDQEWGFVEIRPGAHAFYWLYYVDPTIKSADFDVYSRPLIIWLQGGPGYGASGLGNFGEIGPIDINGEPREFTWVKNYNVLFIDAPVGSGFSFADSDNVFNTEDSAAVHDIVSVIKYFLETFRKFQPVPTYIVGQSYGAKLAVDVAWELDQGARNVPINLKGLGLGAPGISSLDALLDIPGLAYHMGLVDAQQREALQQTVDDVRKPVEEERWADAVDKCGRVLIKVWSFTGVFDYNNILDKWQPSIPYNHRILKINDFMNRNVRPALNITYRYGVQMNEVFEGLLRAYMKPAFNSVKRLLTVTDLKVAIYSGQLDFAMPTTSILAWLDRILADNAGWRNAVRSQLLVNNVVEGYQKHFGDLSMYWVFGAGHWAPQDNPRALRRILQNLIGS